MDTLYCDVTQVVFFQKWDIIAVLLLHRDNNIFNLLNILYVERE